MVQSKLRSAKSLRGPLEKPYRLTGHKWVLRTDTKRLRERAHGEWPVNRGCTLSMAPDYISPCLFGSCSVFFIWTFEFEHCSLIITTFHFSLETTTPLNDLSYTFIILLIANERTCVYSILETILIELVKQFRYVLFVDNEKNKVITMYI